MEIIKAMFLYGASGHAKVIKEILESQGKTITGFIDDNIDIMNLEGLDVYRPTKLLVPALISIGNNTIRKSIALRFSNSYITAIHQSAVVSPSAIIGEGSVIMAGVVINASVRIGKHCIINTGATIDHDCIIGDYCHISPNSTLCGNVTISEGVWIGAGSTIIQGIKIGDWTQIGAGSVVVKDIPKDVLAYGNPCKVIRNINNV